MRAYISNLPLQRLRSSDYQPPPHSFTFHNVFSLFLSSVRAAKAIEFRHVEFRTCHPAIKVGAPAAPCVHLRFSRSWLLPTLPWWIYRMGPQYHCRCSQRFFKYRRNARHPRYRHSDCTRWRCHWLDSPVALLVKNHHPRLCQ